MAQNPVVLIHGYSDKGASFRKWRDALRYRGYKLEEISICNYQSLTNEITIKDIAEGFDRALKTRAHLDADQPFDAILHSTGMLVLRSWLTTYEGRRGRLKHLIGLAPATFGSPLAHKGRGFIGAIFKGNREFGPDFLEAGDLVLDGLELASRFTWDLTHADLLCEKPFYGRGPDTPYVFIFCGTESYKGIRQLANEPGTDGTVRWAGCGLTTQKITIDLTVDSAAALPSRNRVTATDNDGREVLPMPFWPVAGKNHATLLLEPEDGLVDLVASALEVDGEDTFQEWQEEARQATSDARGKITEWQQFVVRVVDERGDPISDYHIELFTKDDGGHETIGDFDFDVHAYGADKSLRCFHVQPNLIIDKLKQGGGGNLWARIIAPSGSALVGYHGLHSEKLKPDLTSMEEDGVWDAQIELPLAFNQAGVKLFYPFTTTFVELKLNRDPMPFGKLKNRICEMLDLEG